LPATAKLPAADPILKRNPFDSVTGPLDGTVSEDDDEDEEIPEEPNAAGLPDADKTPKCSFGRVVLIAANSDPEWSFAAIDAGEGEAKLRRVGDQVKEHALEALAWDRVYLVKGADRCQMQVGDRSSAPTPAAKAPAPTRRTSARGGDLPPELASKIHKISDTEYNIERSVVDEILEKQAELMKYTRLRPIKEGDKVVGMRVSRVREGTLFGVLGLKNGDQISSINGFDLTDPQRALEAYGKLRTADKLTLNISRNGAPVSMNYNIQ
jgi:general secretion pathway protein C